MTKDHALASAFAAGSLVLYGATAAPSVATVFDDSLEFQVVLPTLGIAHPSGYPLYTLVGKLFTVLVPFRDPAGRANLLSAVAAAAAVGFLYLLARRVARNRAAAAIVTLAFAVSPVWWSQATIAEVYALHGLFVTLLLYMLLRWEDEVTAQRPRAGRWLERAALVTGLGLAHHRMIALLLPAALALVLWTDPGLLRQPRRWGRLPILGLAPLVLYLYLPLRGQVVSSLDGTYRPTLSGTLNWILASDYRVFLTGNPFGVQRTPGFFLGLIVNQFGPVLLLVAIWGLLAGRRFGMARYVFLLLATILQMGFSVAYKAEDIGVFFIPVFLLIALWAALGLVPALDGAAAAGVDLARRLQLPRAARPWVLGASAVLLAGLMLFEPMRAALRNLPELDRSDTWEVHDMGRDMLASAGVGSDVVGLQGEITLMRYFRDVAGPPIEVNLVAADDEAARYAAIEQALARGRAAFLTRDLPGVSARYSLDAAGPLIAVHPKAAASAPAAGRPVGDHLLFLGGASELRDVRSGRSVRIHAAWSAVEAVPEELKISARLLDANGNVVAAEDTAPVHFAYPTTAWVPGERVEDSYDISLPADALPAAYEVLLILYKAADGSETGRIELPAVQVSQ